MPAGFRPLVIPAEAGISMRKGAAANPMEIPAFAGMTILLPPVT